MFFRKSSCTEFQLEQFLLNNSYQFGEGYRKFCLDCKYAQKLFNYAEKYEFWRGNELVGLICVYENKTSNFSYIPYVCISEAEQGNHLASDLMRIVLNDVIPFSNFIGLEVRKENIPAYNLYLKFGFKEISSREEKIQMRKYF